MRSFLVDVETTGLDPKKDKVCEIAWRQIDDQFAVISENTCLINPLCQIPSSASSIHGITDLMVRDAPSLDEYFNTVGDIFNSSDLVFVAHNAKFDRDFLKDFIHPDAQSLCTLRTARQIYPNADSHKLSALAYSLGLEIDRAKVHSADGDLDLLQQLLMRLCADAGCGIDALIKVSNTHRKVSTMPFGKHKGAPLVELPKSYITWLLTEANIDDDLRASLMEI